MDLASASGDQTAPLVTDTMPAHLGQFFAKCLVLSPSRRAGAADLLALAMFDHVRREKRDAVNGLKLLTSEVRGLSLNLPKLPEQTPAKGEPLVPYSHISR